MKARLNVAAATTAITAAARAPPMRAASTTPITSTSAGVAWPVSPRSGTSTSTDAPVHPRPTAMPSMAERPMTGSRTRRTPSTSPILAYRRELALLPPRRLEAVDLADELVEEPATEGDGARWRRQGQQVVALPAELIGLVEHHRQLDRRLLGLRRHAVAEVDALV